MSPGFRISAPVALFLVIIIMMGCNQPPSTPPPPTPQPIFVAYPPSLKPLTIPLHNCAVEHPELALFVAETPSPSLSVGDAHIVLWLGHTLESGDFITPLAWERLYVILHPGNPLSRLSAMQLTGLFSGQISNWSELGGDDLVVEVWVYPPENDVRALFVSAGMDGKPFSSQARLAPDPAAMLEIVSSHPAAIGFLPGAWLTSQVKSVRLPRSLEVALRQPVLALSSSEPQGPAWALLLCLQSSQGQAVLADLYEPWETAVPGQ